MVALVAALVAAFVVAFGNLVGSFDSQVHIVVVVGRRNLEEVVVEIEGKLADQTGRKSLEVAAADMAFAADNVVVEIRGFLGKAADHQQKGKAGHQLEGKAGHQLEGRVAGKADWDKVNPEKAKNR